MPKFVLPKFAVDRALILNRLDFAIGSLAVGKEWEIEIKEKKAGRSLSQNRMLWALYTDIIRLGGEAMQGWTKEDLHSFFLCDHFGTEIVEMFGKKRQVPLRSSSKLSKAEFVEFCDHIIRFMAERGVPLSDPHQRV